MKRDSDHLLQMDNVSYSPVSSEEPSHDSEYFGDAGDSDIDISTMRSVDDINKNKGHKAGNATLEILPTLRDMFMRNSDGTASIRTKLNRIEKGATYEQLRKKKRLKTNHSIKDWWIWYWQAPKAHFPFLYFMLVLLSCVMFAIYWFMDNDSAFILCGFVAFCTFGFGAHKFKLTINLKKEIDKYTRLNYKFKKENKMFEQSLESMRNAQKMLSETRTRLVNANNKNRENLKKFNALEKNMALWGKEAKTNLGEVNKISQDIREKWRQELLTNDREMLHAVFNRYERLNTNKTQHGLTKEDFAEFQRMLPKRYEARFDRLGTFHAFAGDKKRIHRDDFVNTLDTFAVMETDNTDIEFVIEPKSNENPEISSFRFSAVHKNPWFNMSDIEEEEEEEGSESF